VGGSCRPEIGSHSRGRGFDSPRLHLVSLSFSVGEAVEKGHCCTICSTIGYPPEGSDRRSDRSTSPTRRHAVFAAEVDLDHVPELLGEMERLPPRRSKDWLHRNSGRLPFTERLAAWVSGRSPAVASQPDNTRYRSGTPSDSRSPYRRGPTFPSRRLDPPHRADGHAPLRSECSCRSGRTPCGARDWLRFETATPSAPLRFACLPTLAAVLRISAAHRAAR